MSEPSELGVVGTGRLASAVRQLATDEGVAVRVYEPRAPRDWREGPSVLIDCSAPPVLADVAAFAAETGTPLLACVSGLDDGQVALLADLAGKVPVARAHNLTLGNYLQTCALRAITGVVRTMQRAGIDGIVPEAAVLERHPATKAHRPSTTAVVMARRWREGVDAEPVDVASARYGAGVSDHALRLTWPDQALTITHEVRSLTAAAAGAIGVAGWLAGRDPGQYDVHDIFDDMIAAMAAEHDRGGTR